MAKKRANKIMSPAKEFNPPRPVNAAKTPRTGQPVRLTRKQ